MCVAIAFKSECYVINFEFNLSFFSKPFSVKNKKVKKKIY